jgi:hypothetical protein
MFQYFVKLHIPISEKSFNVSSTPIMHFSHHSSLKLFRIIGSDLLHNRADTIHLSDAGEKMGI